MATKMIFRKSKNCYYCEDYIDYTYYSGFAISQKQKSIKSLHSSINEKYPDSKILEISTKSENYLGVQLSAFNLMFFHDEIRENRHIENVFQSSKVFRDGGPFRDLLNVHPRDAKRDERLTVSGPLVSFNLYGVDWPLEPKSMFYDWLYVSALKQHPALAEELLQYDTFTDIEFNHKKSINCQARAAAIFVSLVKNNELNIKTASPTAFATIYGNNEYNAEQLSLF